MTERVLGKHLGSAPSLLPLFSCALTASQPLLWVRATAQAGPAASGTAAALVDQPLGKPGTAWRSHALRDHVSAKVRVESKSQRKRWHGPSALACCLQPGLGNKHTAELCYIQELLESFRFLRRMKQEHQTLTSSRAETGSAIPSGDRQLGLFSRWQLVGAVKCGLGCDKELFPSPLLRLDDINLSQNTAQCGQNLPHKTWPFVKYFPGQVLKPLNMQSKWMIASIRCPDSEFYTKVQL